MNIELIAITQYVDGTTEDLIEHAGRVCYRSGDRSNGNPAPFIRARLRDGHASIIEHASATFEISGISRACSHQLVRHRIASYSQESQRYVSMAEADFIVPDAIDNREAFEIWRDAIATVHDAYNDLCAVGVAKEDARLILPVATITRIIVTMNFRELRHFFTLRLKPAAQWEIREMAGRMLALVRPYAPTVFEDVGV